MAQDGKNECIRPGTPLSLEDARRLVGHYVEHYNNERLHSVIGYIAPKDKLEGLAEVIFQQRVRKLEAAQQRRKERCHSETPSALQTAHVGKGSQL